MRLATKLTWIAGPLLALGIIAAVSAYPKQANPNPQAGVAQNQPSERSTEEVALEVSSERSSTVPATAKTRSSASPAVRSARVAAANAADIDWEHLVAQTPEIALSELERAVPKDEAEAQRFSVYEVRALTKLQRMGEAHAKAEAYFERWPAGPDGALLGGLTGAHPKR